MSKQDRQGVRTAADVERKYNFGKSFAEVMGLAGDAVEDAKKAQSTANAAQKTATEAKAEIVKLSDSITFSVTGGGPGNTAKIVLKVGEKEYSGTIDLTGLVTFTGLKEEGKTEINGANIITGTLTADMLKSGVLASADGTVKIDLANNCVTVDGTKDGYKTQIKISASGFQGYGENSEGKMEHVLDFDIGVGGRPTGILNLSHEESVGLLIAAVSGTLTLGTSEAYTEIFGDTVSIDSPVGNVKILGKYVHWKDDGAGGFVLAAI